jgi:hypothetical protein
MAQALAARWHAAISGNISSNVECGSSNDIHKMELRGRRGNLSALIFEIN